MAKTKVLFLCTHNSARSQMAEALLKALRKDRYEVYSAGTEPTQIHPLTSSVLREIGIDITGQRSKSIEEFTNWSFDIVVTVCDAARENCPFFPNAAHHLHRSFPDPAAEEDPQRQEQMFRIVRDQIAQWIERTF